MKRLINGMWGKDENIVAFCTCRKHKGYLTRKIRKQHKCMGKHCRFYIPIQKIKRK